MFRKNLIVAIVLIICAAWGGSARAQQHTRGDAQALVYKVSEYLQSHDEQTALAKVSDSKGEFVSGDLYSFVMDFSNPGLPMLAHGVNKALIGKPQIEMKDADGQEFNKTALALVATSGEGWVNYKWSDPVTRRIRPKATFYKKMGNYLIGSGVYD